MSVASTIWISGRYLARGTAEPAEEEPNGIFETFVADPSGCATLELHLARMRESAAALGFSPLPRLPDAADVTGLLAREGLARARCRLTLLPSRRSAVLTVEPLEDLTARRARRLVLARVEDSRGPADPPPGHKLVARAALDRAREAAHRRGADDALLVAEGMVLETTIANVFVVDRTGVLVTPPLDGRVLPGVTRARVLHSARAHGIAVGERPVEIDEIRHAREVFVTNAVVLVQMVRQIPGVFSSEDGDVDRWLLLLARSP